MLAALGLGRGAVWRELKERSWECPSLCGGGVPREFWVEESKKQFIDMLNTEAFLGGVHLSWQVNEAPGSEEVWRDGVSHGASQRPGPPRRPWILAWEDWS